MVTKFIAENHTNNTEFINCLKLYNMLWVVNFWNLKVLMNFSWEKSA